MANYFPVSFKLIIEETKAKFLPKSRSISVPNSLVKILHLMCQVWYCSANCKKADIKLHTSVCRAYITVRR